MFHLLKEEAHEKKYILKSAELKSITILVIVVLWDLVSTGDCTETWMRDAFVSNWKDTDPDVWERGEIILRDVSD